MAGLYREEPVCRVGRSPSSFTQARDRRIGGDIEDIELVGKRGWENTFLYVQDY